MAESKTDLPIQLTGKAFVACQRMREAKAKHLDQLKKLETEMEMASDQFWECIYGEFPDLDQAACHSIDMKYFAQNVVFLKEKKSNEGMPPELKEILEKIMDR